MAKNTLTACAAVLVIPAIAGAAPAARSAAPGVHPVVWASYSGLMGGSVDGQWKTGDQMIQWVKGGERYRLYSMTKSLGEGIGGKLSEDPHGSPGIEITPCPDADGEIIAVGGDWDALPRVPKVQSTTQKVYHDVIRALLRRKGLGASPVKIQQILRVDLEGDGQDEVLVAASTLAAEHISPGHDKGDYSLLLLRKIVEGRVKDILLSGEFHKKAADFDAPLVFDVAAVLDVNGDGVMEIVERSRYYEGQSLGVYTVEQGKVKLVLVGGWGA